MNPFRSAAAFFRRQRSGTYETSPQRLSEPQALPEWHRYYGVERLTPEERARATRFDALVEPFVLRWADGLAFRIVPREQLSRVVYVSGAYEPNTMVALRALLREGDVFLDVGANAGIFALAAAQWVGPTGLVVAFEPSSREFARLTDTMESNTVPQVRIRREAVSRTPGSARLRVAADTYSGLNTLGERFAYAGVDAAQLEEVPVVTLDGFVEAHAVPRVTAIKIDVEGSECDVLAGAQELLRRDRPALVIEVFAAALASTGATIAGLEEILNRAGYRCHAIRESDARLEPISTLTASDGQNIVALPR